MILRDKQGQEFDAVVERRMDAGGIGVMSIVFDGHCVGSLQWSTDYFHKYDVVSIEPPERYDLKRAGFVWNELQT